jgi:hypothetical protein
MPKRSAGIARASDALLLTGHPLRAANVCANFAVSGDETGMKASQRG